jgi:coiled-coil domain-containing protein 130
LFDDAMFKLEHGTEDLDKAKKAAPILVKLHDVQDAKWNDDFAANSLLRQQLRVRFILKKYKLKEYFFFITKF